MSALEDIVKETRNAFVVAKSDSVLDAGEVIQIAVRMAQKIQKLANLSGSEKKALLLHTLKKGLDDDGGIDALAMVKTMSSESKDALKVQLISAASVSIDMILSAASGKLDLKKPTNWKACVPVCIGLAEAVVPEKEKALLSEALAFANSFFSKSDIDEKLVIHSPVISV